MMTGNSKWTGRGSTVAVFVIAALAMQGCTRDPNVRKAKYLESGKKYAAQGKNKEAIIQFSNAIKIDPRYAPAHFELAKSYLKLGSGLAAFTELRKTVQLDPQNVEAHLDMGEMLLAGRQYKPSVQEAKTILGINPKNADAYALLAGNELATGDHEQALKDIQQALAIDPNRAGFHAQLGVIQNADPATQGQAETQLQEAVRLDPKNSAAHLVLAGMLEKKGDYNGAVAQAQSATQSDPKNMRAWIVLASLYFHHGDKPQAEATLMHATDALHDSTQGADLLRGFLEQTGQTERASTVYADLANKYPKSVPIKMAYAHVLADQGNYAKVQQIVDELNKTDKDDPQVEALTAMLMLRSGKINDANALLQKAVKNSPDNQILKFWYGQTQKAKGDISGAEQTFRDIVRVNPGNLQATKELAQIAAQNHDFTLLSQLAETVITKVPDSPDGYVWRGMTELNQNNATAAEGDFQTALKKNPKDVEALVALGQLRFKDKKFPEGAQYLQQAVDVNPNLIPPLQLLVGYYLFQHQPDKALDLVRQQVAKAPNNSLLLDQLAELQLATHDAAGAAGTAQKAMQMNPADGTAVMAYTRATVAQGNVAGAIAKWQTWTDAHPGDANAQVVLGNLEEGKGDGNAAMAAYKKALAIQPDQPIAANDLAFLMLQSGQDLDVALSLAQTARRAMPHSPNTADTLAWAYYHKGIYGSARDLLQDAEKESPNDASIQYHLGMTLSKLGDKANAITHLKKAVSLAPNSQTAGEANKALNSLG
ncbi:MAG TPA: tetratricopeptide repeat protein [Acidobacteriaceae bacterium]|nr:tetratricopeptide repeat protein [Acidobacteriaceae bacterium]